MKCFFEYIFMNKNGYFIPDLVDYLLSEEGRGGGVFFNTGPVLSRERALSVRCSLACRALYEGEKKPEEIALSLDFSDYAEFSYHFTRLLGLSPRQYRKRFSSLSR